MSNLFKKGFASVALASAMASGVFAGNAAYIDVKVNYLSGMGKAVLGYDETAGDNIVDKRLNEVELLVSILDKDGNYATKNAKGSSPIDDLVLDGVAIGADNIDGDSESKSGTVNAITSDGVITRSLNKLKNVHRFVIDYSEAEVSELMDTVTLTSGTGSGKIERMVNINLTTREAKGLIVRATPNSTFQTEKYINEEFTKLEVLSEGSDYRLGTESPTSPGGLAGVTIPLQVYASTKGYQDSSTGRFTLDPDLNGKIIIVQALADYNNDGNASVVLNSVELDPMVNGQATGKIVITHAMPSTITTDTVTAGYGDAGDGGGLGIVLVAYVKDKQSINSYADDKKNKIRDNTVMANFDFNATKKFLGNSSDAIQVRSGEPIGLKVGKFDINATESSKLFTATSEIFNISEGADLTVTNDGTSVVSDISSVTKIFTVVDSFGNPIGLTGTTVVSKINDELSKNNTKLVTIASSTISTVNEITRVTVTAGDSNETNNTLGLKTQKLNIDVSDGALSNVKSKDITLRTLPLIEVTKNGGPNWIEAVSDVRTKNEFSQSDHAFLKKEKDVKRANENDFTIVIKSGLDDLELDDRNATFRVYIKNESDEGGFLDGTELANYSLEIIAEGSDGSSASVVTAGILGSKFNQANLFYDDGGKAVKNEGTKGTKEDGYQRFDFWAAGTTTDGVDTVNGVDDFAIQISTTASSENADIVVATIHIQNFNAAEIKEEEITINIPANEDKYTAAFVDVYMENVGDDLKEIPVGSIVNFKFTGSAVSTGDVIEIDMNSSGLVSADTEGKANGKTNTEGRIGLVGSDISINKDGKIKTTLPENHIVSVILYDANKSDGGVYGFQRDGSEPVKINGRKPVWLNLQDDEDDTPNILELAIGSGITTLRSKKDAISQIRINLPATPVDKGDGSEEDKADAFGTDEDFMYDGMFNGKANAVKTGLIYSLFNAETNVVLLDKYKNEIEGLKEDIGKDVTYTTTDGMEFKNNGADNSWIKFKAEAVKVDKFGKVTEQPSETLTITRTKADGEKITKTITWTNIKLNELNTKFMVTTDSNGPTDPNTGAFDVVNSEVVVKVIGDGGTKQSSTTIKVTHSDKTAIVRLVKISGLKTKNLYTDQLIGATSSTADVIQVKGNYYILSSDKVGDVIITATAKGKDSKGADISVTGTHTITFDAIDLDKPVINGDDVKVANGEVSVLVQDANLDTVKTTVVVKDRDGKKVADGVYTNGKFTAKVASSGTYLIDVIAFDMAGNVQLDNKGKPQPFEFVRIAGSGAATVEEKAVTMLLATKEYTVAGTFRSHKFGDEKAKNWVYTKADGKSYALLGETPSDEDIFGFGTETVDVKLGTENIWYMIQTGTGNFDWALANADGIAYKLKGAKADGSFDFSGRLNLNVSHKDGMLTFTAK